MSACGGKDRLIFLNFLVYTTYLYLLCHQFADLYLKSVFRGTLGEMGDLKCKCENELF